MASVNKVILIGNLGRDPEVKYTQAGKAVANMRIATTEAWTDAGSGEKKEQTDWHTVVAWGKTAENAGQFLAKGRQVYVEGKLRTREYEKGGQKRTSIEVHADKLVFLGGRDDGSRRSGAPEADAFAPPPDRGYQGPGNDDIPF